MDRKRLENSLGKKAQEKQMKDIAITRQKGFEDARIAQKKLDEEERVMKSFSFLCLCVHCNPNHATNVAELAKRMADLKAKGVAVECAVQAHKAAEVSLFARATLAALTRNCEQAAKKFYKMALGYIVDVSGRSLLLLGSRPLTK